MACSSNHPNDISSIGSFKSSRDLKRAITSGNITFHPPPVSSCSRAAIRHFSKIQNELQTINAFSAGRSLHRAIRTLHEEQEAMTRSNTHPALLQRPVRNSTNFAPTQVKSNHSTIKASRGCIYDTKSMTKSREEQPTFEEACCF